MKRWKYGFLVLMSFLSIMCVSACERDSVGDKIEETGEEAVDETKDAAGEVRDEVDDATH